MCGCFWIGAARQRAAAVAFDIAKCAAKGAFNSTGDFHEPSNMLAPLPAVPPNLWENELGGEGEKLHRNHRSLLEVRQRPVVLVRWAAVACKIYVSSSTYARRAEDGYGILCGSPTVLSLGCTSYKPLCQGQH